MVHVLEYLKEWLTFKENFTEIQFIQSFQIIQTVEGFLEKKYDRNYSNSHLYLLVIELLCPYFIPYSRHDE